MIVFGTLIIAACLVSGMVFVASYRTQRYATRIGVQADLAQAGSSPEPALPQGVVDIAAELRAACIKWAPVVAEHLVDMDTAVQPSLLVRADQAVVRASLDAVLAESLKCAAYGRLLLSALRLEPWVHIILTDDNAAVGQDRREAALRDAAQSIALQGGSLAVESRSEGGTVTVRLPAVMSGAEPAPRSQPAQPEPSARLFMN